MHVRSPLRLVVLAALSLGACAKQEILHDLDEREANEIVVLLDTQQVSAQKLPDVAGGGGGNKGPKFMISVPGPDANKAWKILTDNQLPRRKDLGWNDVFSQGGLIPTASEEKAKTISAVCGELARTLKSIDGVLDARVHVVMPEDSVLRAKEDHKTETTASVWYKYVPRGKNQQKPLTDQEIQDLIAHSIEGLRPEKVKVIATPALGLVTAGFGDPGSPDQLKYERMIGIAVLSSDIPRFRFMMIGMVGFVVLISLLFTFALVRKSGADASPRGMTRPPGDTLG